MSYDFRPLQVQDFSGGITDDYVTGNLKLAKTMQNFVILENKTLKTRKGTTVDSDIDAQIPAGGQRVASLINYKNDTRLLVHSSINMYFRDPVNYSTLQGPSGNPMLASGNANTQISYTEWNGLLLVGSDEYTPIQKIYQDDTGTMQLRTAGVPALSYTPTVTGSVGTTHSYIYAFHYRFTYKIGTRTFIDDGPVTRVQITTGTPPETNLVNITGLIPLVNGAGENYDVSDANMKLMVYRTIDGGTELYQIAALNNSDLFTTDNQGDATVQLQEELYTNGDVPDNDQPPAAKFVHTVNNFTYYANYKKNGEIFDSYIIQSQGLDPDSCPEGFNQPVEQPITGLSSVDGKPIVACERYIYRIDGSFDRAGTGAMTYNRISDHAGCISNSSMVQAEKGLFWAGTDGFYFTDGYIVKKVSDHLNETYKKYLDTLDDYTKIKGIYDERNRLIHWTFSRSLEGVVQDCDILFTLDLRATSTDNATFNIWSGGDSFLPTSITVFNGDLYRGDAKGYVLVFRDDQVADPKIESGVDPTTWAKETIVYDYVSAAYNFNTDYVRKVANKCFISCRNLTNASIGIQVINDDGKLTRNVTPIRWRKNFTWGDEEFTWGDTAFVWNVGGLIEEVRRLPRGGYRFNKLQIRITNALINIINSDTYGNVQTDSGLKTATLINASVKWLSDSVDYYIKFESNNYTTEHKIVSRSNTTIVYEDPSGNIDTSASQAWQVVGYRKNEVINLNSYTLSWAFATGSHADYSAASSGNLGG